MALCTTACELLPIRNFLAPAGGSMRSGEEQPQIIAACNPTPIRSRPVLVLNRVDRNANWLGAGLPSRRISAGRTRGSSVETGGWRPSRLARPKRRVDKQVFELARLRAPVLLGSLDPRAQLGSGVPRPARVVQHA